MGDPLSGSLTHVTSILGQTVSWKVSWSYRSGELFSFHINPSLAVQFSHSMVVSFHSILRKQSISAWHFLFLALQVTQYRLIYILLVKAVTRTHLDSRGGDTHAITQWGINKILEECVGLVIIYIPLEKTVCYITMDLSVCKNIFFSCFQNTIRNGDIVALVILNLLFICMALL